MVDIQYNKNNLVIIGAGGLGREIYSWFSQSNKYIENYNCLGFIDDDSSKLDGFGLGLEILESLVNNNLIKYPNLILAINNSEVKSELFSRIDSNYTKIIGFIHQNCVIGINSSIDKTVTVFPFVTISCFVTIARGVFINNGSQIGHDVTIGEFTNIMANVDIGGECKIGKNVFIGTGVTILPRVTIPDNCIIGAGSVVFRNIKTAGTYVGNPAKRLI